MPLGEIRRFICALDLYPSPSIMVPYPRQSVLQLYTYQLQIPRFLAYSTLMRC